MRLHRIVLFVGDRPTARNVHPDVPFVGTKSYKTLLEWIYRMDLDIHDVQIRNAYDKEGEVDSFFPVYCSQQGYAIVALGDEAVKRLNADKIKHFKLPHPSGLNRILNDKKELARLLYRCKKYIYKTT